MAKRLIQLGYANRFHFYFRGSPVYQEYYQEVKKEIFKSGLGAHFTFEQYDPQLSLADIYNRYTATVLLSQYEGFGLPVIESQAFGKPVICSEIPVFKEILGDTAIYLESEPTDQHLEQLVNQLSDPDSIQRIIEKGKKNAAKYQWERTCNDTMHAYLELLK